MRAILFLLLFLPVVCFGATTDPIYYSTEDDAGMSSSLRTTHIPLANSAQKTLNNDTSTPLYYHFIFGVTIDVDPNGQSGVPTGESLTAVTLYLNTVGCSSVGRTVEVRDVVLLPNTPTWKEYDSVAQEQWAANSGLNNDHIADTTAVLDTETTTTTGAELLTFTITTAEEFDGATITGPVSMYFLVRMTNTGNVTFYTTGANRPRFVFTYTGAQPPTPTATNTPSNTPTPTYTPSNTPTPVPGTNTPTPTFTPLPTGLPVLVAGVAGIASPENEVLYDEGNEVLIVPAIKFADGTGQSTASGAGVNNFSDLGEVPGYAGNTLEVLRVNAGESAIESVGISSIAAQPTHTHTTDQVTEGSNQYWTSERTEDQVNSLIVAGDGLDKTYSDAGNTLTLDVAGLTTSEFASAAVSQWTNDANYLTSVSGISFDAIDSGLTQGAVPFGHTDESATFDATNFLFDNANNRLGLGTNAPDYTLDVAGNAGFDEYFYHNGDTDTYIRYQTDQASLLAGGLNIIDGINTTQDLITIGAASDIDIKLDDDVFVQGSDGFVGIGNQAPASKLEIEGAGGSTYGLLYLDDSADADSVMLDPTWGLAFSRSGSFIDQLYTGGSMTFRTSAASARDTIVFSYTSAGATDFNYDMNVDGAAVVDQGLTVGNSSYTTSKTVSPISFQPMGSWGVRGLASNIPYWEMTTTSADEFMAPMPAMAPGTVIEKIRFYVRDTGSAGDNDYVFSAYKVTHTTGAVATGTQLHTSGTIDTSLGLTLANTADYYYDLSAGSFPYTVVAGDTFEIEFRIDTSATPSTAKFLSAEVFYRERKY